MTTDTITLTVAEAEAIVALGHEVIKLFDNVDAAFAHTYLGYDGPLPNDATIATAVGTMRLYDLRRLHRRARKVRRRMTEGVKA